MRTSEQLEDYRTVIAWVRQREEFDSQRVILWGTSYSGALLVRFVCRRTQTVFEFVGGHAVSLASEPVSPVFNLTALAEG